jgi:endoglucanase
MKFAALAAAAAMAGPFYADPDSSAERQARKYENQGRTADEHLMRSLSAVPQAFWFTAGTPKQVRKQVDRTVDKATAAKAVAVLVAYNVPNRDCGSYSAGGARNYRRWIDGFARGVKDRQAVIIVEPDAIAAGCGKRRFDDVHDAVMRLTKLPNAAVYIDAGHSKWQPVATMARRLRRVAIAKAEGFALNVSNFRATDEIVAFGTELSNRLNHAHFVIDTSRNGLGPKGAEWCNPPGRGLGAPPTSQTGIPLVDAFLWIKTPGESDGECRNAPKAGRWWPRYALGLARRANPPLP